MQYNPRTDEQEESVQPGHAEFELQSELDTPALQPTVNEVPQPTRSEEPRTVTRRIKAMAATAPGSEYWFG